MALATADKADLLIRLKVVPGSSRDAIAGVLGDRLKVKVAAAPEAGRANAAVCTLLAKALGVKPRELTVEAGATSPDKTVRVRSISVEEFRSRLGLREVDPKTDPDR